MNMNYQSSITVKTKDELQQAKEKKYDEIIVIGDLANKLIKAKKITKLSAATLGILGAAIVAAPATGGISGFAAAPIAAMTGLELSAVIAASFMGIGFIIALFKDYKLISFNKDGVVLRKE